MNRLRISVCFASLVLLGICVQSLSLRATSDWVCCETESDCTATGGKCCDAALMGADPCTPDRVNYCMNKCTMAGGS